MASAAQTQATGEEAVTLLREPRIDTLSTLKKLNVKGMGLTCLPDAISHCLQLEFLEVTGNPLQGLPESIAKLPKLDTLFAAGVGWTEIPKVLASCPSLRMLGVRDNQIVSLDGESLPECLVWLIAAGNKIESLPNIARLKHIRKLMLSHNRLTCSGLEPVAGIEDLEMVRVAANRLEAFPQSLFRHRRLAWVAVGGNPFTEAIMKRRLESAPAPVDFSEVCLGERLGSGAGATVYQGTWRGQDVAVKIWDAERFSDGTSRGEWAASRVASNPGHPSMVKVLSAFEEPKPGMILELLPGASAAAGPPLSSTVTRDALPIHGGPGPWYSIDSILTISRAVAQACAHLRAQGLMHGDIYLHNTLIQWEGSKECAAVLDARLSDLGAAAAVDDPGFEKLEVRSYGWLLKDLLESLSAPPEAADDSIASKRSMLHNLCDKCLDESIDAVPTFAEILKELEVRAPSPSL